MAIVIEGGHMKRVLMGLLVLLGFVVAGCEKEIIREYPREGGRRHREWRLNDEAVQNGSTQQIEAEVQP